MAKSKDLLLLLASGGILVAIIIQRLIPYLLPHGPAVDVAPQHRPVSVPIDPNNKSLQFAGGGNKLTKIYERRDGEDGNKQQQPLLVKPETILFDNENTMYIMNENAQLISLTNFQEEKSEQQQQGESVLSAKATEVANLGVGRPLGGKFDKKGCLYYADVILGLARVCNIISSTASFKSNNNVVEIVASRVKLDDGSWSPIMYADDVDIGPRTGHVYFSDATDVSTDRDFATGGKLDNMYSSKIEGLRGKRTGRILRYKPETGDVDILVPSVVAFANGVAVDKDERYLLYTSTMEGAVYKHHLTGEKEGMTERLLDGFPGFLDGIDCSFQHEVCFVAIPSTVPFVVATIFSLPHYLSRPIRNFLMMIPRTWAPKPEHYGATAEIHPGDDNTKARIIRIFQDPTGKEVEMITGVTENDGKLYLGSLQNNFVGVLDLD